MKRIKGKPEPVEEISAERQIDDEKMMETAAAKRIRRRRIYGIITVGIAALVVAVIIALPSPDRTADSVTVNEEVLSGAVSDSDISSTLSGAGTLKEEDGTAVTIPDVVAVECYYVENGDMVEAGDRIARANADSVDAAIAELQQVIDELDSQLYEESVKEADESIAASVSGRVKMIYAQEGMPVADTVYEYGSLMILSLDGRMSAEIESDADVSTDDSVTVEFPDGTVLEGRIASVSTGNGTVTVTVSDEEAAYGESVSVYDENGDLMGMGVLSAHSELKVVGYTGTVSSVDVGLNDIVNEGDILMDIEDTGHTALYTALLSRRWELEDQMNSLYTLKGDGYILAECDGVISGIPDDAVISKDTDSSDSVQIQSAYGDSIHYTSAIVRSDGIKTVPLANDPVSTEDGTVLVNYVGQVVSVDNEEKVISVNLHRRSVDIGDYTDLEDLGSYPLNEALEMSYDEISGFLEYDQEGEEWHYMDFGELEPGDHIVITWLFNSGTEDDEGNVDEGSYSLAWIIRFESDNDEESGETEGADDETGEEDEDEFSEDDTALEDEQIRGSSGEMGDYSGLMQNSFDTGMFGGDRSFSGSLDDLYSLLNGEYMLDSFGEMEDYSDLMQNSYDTGSFGGDWSFYGSVDNIYDSLSEEIASAEIYAYETYSISEKRVAQVTPQDVMTVEITIDELDILSVEAGHEAEVTVDALKGRTFTGVVTEVASSGTNSGGNTKYSVEITLDRDEQMLDGMNASVNMISDTKSCGMTVPVAALVEENGKTYVYTGYDERNDTLTDPVEVKTGISDETTVEILSGLEADDTYYYRYAETMTYNFLTMLR